jgi:hypothetical protein
MYVYNLDNSVFVVFRDVVKQIFYKLQFSE